MVKYSVILLVLLLHGCASNGTVTPLLYHDRTKDTNQAILRTPELGVAATVEIGDSMYEKSYLLPKEGLIKSWHHRKIHVEIASRKTTAKHYETNQLLHPCLRQ